jgi:hypothetical protein
MVNKSSFFDRLFHKRDAGPVPQKAGQAAGGGPARGNGGSAGGVHVAAAPAPQNVQPVNRLEPAPVEAETRKLSRKEDAISAVTEGLSDLGNLLRGINSRMEEGNERSGLLATRFEDFPATTRAQIELLGVVSRQLEESRGSTRELMEKFGEMPDLLRGIHQVLERQAATEERTEGTLKDFRNTMDRINGSIAKLSEEHSVSLKETHASFERNHAQSVRVFEQTQKDSLQTFRQSQEGQSRQLAALLDSSGKMSRAILVFLIMIFTALVSIFVVVLSGR